MKLIFVMCWPSTTGWDVPGRGEVVLALIAQGQEGMCSAPAGCCWKPFSCDCCGALTTSISYGEVSPGNSSYLERGIKLCLPWIVSCLVPNWTERQRNLDVSSAECLSQTIGLSGWKLEGKWWLGGSEQRSERTRKQRGKGKACDVIPGAN